MAGNVLLIGLIATILVMRNGGSGDAYAFA
jgi:hypothetical protein